MKKILLLLLVLGGLAMLDPRVREWALQFAGPIGEVGQRRSAERALDDIAAELAKAATETGVYPQPGSLRLWLQGQDLDGTDPWGSAYYLELFADSFVVGSPGPDARVRSDDDLRLAQRRVQPKPGVLINDDLQPAPPPSSAARTGKSKAMEAARRR
ncbi:MAG: hypothetical protein GWN99_00510 [Gemmatimonadetes bacterium]|uniref:Uncharacterized protein n=1 Tax=Candidatus Kutchimonas denitrificans TaxID=3056748 RepID=A0AAE5CBZ5_9BACT|nr:hypothetical protein [Gemmatimonadota bacterium]NIR73589.1 hypothetical protein [Candidatus Kutchimonas denitrificans]NIR99548.1 hypothetical protein [Gemmatimonadota bacterium]NIT65168.1 hypothetical protein [Gemmatimonadota bacterium]NIV23701.1 hypothetical protein [Gemmatimonadota bacterium]